MEESDVRVYDRSPGDSKRAGNKGNRQIRDCHKLRETGSFVISNNVKEMMHEDKMGGLCMFQFV